MTARATEIFAFLAEKVAKTQRFRLGIVAVCLLIALAFVPVAATISATRVDAHPIVPVWLTTLCVALLLVAAAARIVPLYKVLRAHPTLLVLPAIGSLVVSGVDGWIRSGFYYPTLPLLAIAAVVGGRLLTFGLALLLAVGNFGVALVVGFSPHRMAELHVLGDTSAAGLGMFAYAVVCVVLVERETKYLISTPRRLTVSARSFVPKAWVPQASTRNPLLDSYEQLTPAEREVLSLLPFGLTAAEIGKQLDGLPEQTVLSRIRTARTKLNARNRRHLVKLLCTIERTREASD